MDLGLIARIATKLAATVVAVNDGAGAGGGCGGGGRIKVYVCL